MPPDRDPQLVTFALESGAKVTCSRAQAERMGWRPAKPTPARKSKN